MSAERDVAHRQVTLELAQMRLEAETDRIKWNTERRLVAIKSLDEAHARSSQVGERVIQADDTYREALRVATQSNIELNCATIAYRLIYEQLVEQVHADCMDDDLKRMLSEFMLACMAEGVDASV